MLFLWINPQNVATARGNFWAGQFIGIAIDQEVAQTTELVIYQEIDLRNLYLDQIDSHAFGVFCIPHFKQ